MVLSEELAAMIEGTNWGTITPEMPPPELIVEVVLPSKNNEERDYRYKRSEYAGRHPLVRKLSLTLANQISLKAT